MSHKHENNEEFWTYTKITMFDELISCRQKLEDSSQRIDRMAEEIDSLIKKNISFKERISNLQNVIVKLMALNDCYYRTFNEIISGISEGD